MEKKLFNKYFIGITLINFIVYLIYYLLMVIMAVIAQDTLHASLSQAGFASGIYIIGTLLARLFMGKQLELFGRKFTLRGGAIFYLLTTLAYLYTPTIGALYLVRFLNGFGYGTVSTATNAIVTAYIPASKKGEGINYYGLSTSLAAAVGPFLGMILLNMTDFRFIIWFSIVLVFFVTIACLVFPVKNIPLSEEQKTSLRSWNINSFIEKKALFITGIAFFNGSFLFKCFIIFIFLYKSNPLSCCWVIFLRRICFGHHIYTSIDWKDFRCQRRTIRDVS